MILRQFLHTEPVIATSYLFGCGSKATCAVVDPIEDIDLYLRAAKKVNMKIDYVIDTHVHADHISGGRKLAEKVGAKYVLYESSGAKYDYFAVSNNDVIELGNTTIKILHTPGHTPEHITLLVTDNKRGADPWFVCTGHTLMVGDMGRTELASSLEEGARALFESSKKLRKLPDYVEVLPGAYSGSVCGRSLSGKPFSTIGFERKFNVAFKTNDRDTFIKLMQKNVPQKPLNAEKIRAINLGL